MKELLGTTLVELLTLYNCQMNFRWWNLFDLFCLFPGYMAMFHWHGDSYWLAATGVLSSGVLASAYYEEPLPVVAWKIMVHQGKKVSFGSDPSVKGIWLYAMLCY